MSTDAQHKTDDPATPERKRGQWHWLVMLCGVVMSLLVLPEDSIFHPEIPTSPFGPAALDKMTMVILYCVLVPVLAFFLPWVMKGLCYAFVWDGEEYPELLPRMLLHFCLFAWWAAFYAGIGTIFVACLALLPVFENDFHVVCPMLGQGLASIFAGWNGMRIFRPILDRAKNMRFDDENDEA